MAARVGLEVLDIMAEENTVGHARDTGTYLLQQARDLLGHSSCMGEIRGSGQLLGVELVRADGQPLAAEQQVARRAAELCLGTWPCRGRGVCR